MGFCSPFVFRLLTTRDATLVPGQARPGQARPGQARPDQTRPDQRRDQTKRVTSDWCARGSPTMQTRPGQARPDPIRMSHTDADADADADLDDRAETMPMLMSMPEANIDAAMHMCGS